MALRKISVLDVIVVHITVSVSYLGTGSTWCTWKKNLERLFHTGIGPKMGMFHPSGRESELRFNGVKLVDVLAMASPVVTQGLKSIQPD